MKQETKILLGGLVLAGGYLLLKGRALGSLVFFPGGITAIEFQGVTPIVRFALIVQNTNSIGLTLQSLAGNAYTDDAGNSTLIGNVSSFQPVHVAGNSQTVIELSIRMRIISVVDQVISAFQNRNFQKVIKVDAFANVDNIPVPLPVNFSMPVGA